jgi:hypothetical protein
MRTASHLEISSTRPGSRALKYPVIMKRKPLQAGAN